LFRGVFYRNQRRTKGPDKSNCGPEGYTYYVHGLYVIEIFNSRTLTAVHDAILDDLVYPAEIVGKRTRVKLDGTKLLKVHLDRSQQTNIEHKVSLH